MIRPGERLAPRAAALPRPLPPRSLSPRTVLVGAVVVGTVALGGCGAGQVAQTAYQANASGGATVTTNGIAVRDAQIAYGEGVEGADVHPVGGSAPVEMHVINESTQNDRLVSASSPVAASVEISGATDLPVGTVMIVGGESGTGGQSAPGASEAPAEPPIGATLPGGASEASAAPPGSVAPPGSAAEEPADTSPTGSASPSGEAPAAGLQPPPAMAEVSPSTRYAQIVLTGLREDIRAGLTYEIVLTFERAGQVRVALPVAYPAEPREAPEHGG